MPNENKQQETKPGVGENFPNLSKLDQNTMMWPAIWFVMVFACNRKVGS